MIVKKIISTVFLIVIVIITQAQILDDSTKQIYGTHSTKFFTEKELSHLNKQEHSIDTTLTNYHQWEYLFDGKGQFYQDLGGIGSASQSMYYQINRLVGKQLGRDAFSYFAQHNDDVKYYNTKSPHSSFHYQQGANGQGKLDAMFSQNINPNINFGFTFRRFAAIKQIGPNTRKDPFTDHYSAQIFTSIQSTNQRYQLLANFRYFNHTVFEQGGIYTDSLDVLPSDTTQLVADSLFGDYEFSLLDGVKVEDRRNNYHVYHHYQLVDSSDLVYLFHEFDREKQVNVYEDEDISAARSAIGGKSNADFYKQNTYFFSPNKTIDSTVYQLFQNKIGLKGKIGGIYYEGFYKQRNYRFRHYFEENSSYLNEAYIGGVLEKEVLNKYLFNTAIEVSSEGYFLATLEGKYKGIKVGYVSSSQPSTIFQDAYFSNHIQWENTKLEVVNSNQLYGEALLKFKKGTFIKPFFDVTNLNNFIYFGQDSLVHQNTKNIQLLNVGIDAQLKVKSLYFRQFIKYAQSSSDIYKVPKLNSLTQIYFQKPISLIGKKEFEHSGKKKYLLVQIGADFFYKSAYYANAYLPVTQQFYLQDELQAQGYMVADIYFNVQLKRIRSFFKYSHINQGLFGLGYQTTPYYAGKRRAFEVGIGWMFFN